MRLNPFSPGYPVLPWISSFLVTNQNFPPHKNIFNSFYSDLILSELQLTTTYHLGTIKHHLISKTKNLRPLMLGVTSEEKSTGTNGGSSVSLQAVRSGSQNENLPMQAQQSKDLSTSTSKELSDLMKSLMKMDKKEDHAGPSKKVLPRGNQDSLPQSSEQPRPRPPCYGWISETESESEEEAEEEVADNFL